MMRLYKLAILGIIINSCAFCFKLAAQTELPDSSVQLSYKKAVLNFVIGVGDQSRIYNGPEYVFHSNAIHGNAYFDNNSNWEAASVEYDGYVYENVKILYDVYLDRVAVLLYDNFSMFTLLPEKLESFSLSGKRFVNIGSRDHNGGLKPGIYCVVFNRKVSVLKKQVKSLQPIASTTGTPEHYFKGSTSFFIVKDGLTYPVNSKNSVINVLKDKKQELKQYIEEKHIDFKKNLELGILMVATRYDFLTS